MEILHLHSIQEISVTYSTGDAPLFVLSEKGIVSSLLRCAFG